MKKFLTTLCILLMLPLGLNSGILNEASIRVIVNRPVSGGHDHLADPTVLYYPVSKVLTLDFPAADFEPYTITLTTTLLEHELLVTTPFVSLNIAELQGYSININMETVSGDLFYGTLDLDDESSAGYPDE